MGLIKVVVTDEVEQRFRRSAMEEFGLSKGALSKAAQDAFSKWAAQTVSVHDEAVSMGDPIDAVSGILKKVKKSSVELQHEISGLWSHAGDRR